MPDPLRPSAHPGDGSTVAAMQPNDPTTPGPRVHPAITPAFTPQTAAACRQVLTVSAHRWWEQEATITAWQRDGDAWVPAIGPVDGFVGPRGMTTEPYELDYFTPVGVYPISHLFGSQPDPGCTFPYHRCTGNEFWVDDVDSPLYNTFQFGTADDERWESAEHLAMYPYAMAFGFNANPVVRNGNSAIFFHEGGRFATVGCITTERANVVEVLRWFDPACHPHIVLGVQLPSVPELIAGATTVTVRPPRPLQPLHRIRSLVHRIVGHDEDDDAGELTVGDDGWAQDSLF